jgi:AraC-like DNA-binding protein
MNVSYKMIAPPPQLAEVVRFFWVFEIDGIDGTPYIYRSMADGCAELVFHYRGPFTEVDTGIGPLATLHAQTAKHRRFVTMENFGILGAYIYPFAVPRLFGFPASALSDEMPDLQALLGSEGQILLEQIMTAPSETERITRLSRFLIQKLENGKSGNAVAQRAVRTMLGHHGQLSVIDLADKMGISARQLERHFKDYAGFSPKTYARILRFQSALKEYGIRNKALTEIALDCGYYDQAHFIHDFQNFSGYTPSEYFKGKPEGAEYRES